MTRNTFTHLHDIATARGNTHAARLVATALGCWSQGRDDDARRYLYQARQAMTSQDVTPKCQP